MNARRRAVLLLATALGCGSPSKSGGDAGPVSDAGPGDAGAVVPGSDGGLPDGGCPYRFCEEFEDYSGGVTNGMVLGPWTASVGGAGTTVAVDALNPWGGTKALHVTIPYGGADGGSARGTLNQKRDGGLVMGNDLFGRAEIFYADTGSNGLPLAVHSWIFNASGKDPDGGSVTMNLGGGGAKLQINYHPPAPLTEQSVQGGVMTTGTWHCLQWQYDGSGTPTDDVAMLWIDGSPAVTVPASKGWGFPVPWTSFDFGFTHYQTLPNSVEIFLDHLAIDGQRVPCP